MVWKSGKGKSTQLHIEPENMTIQDPFLWRISSATVASAGPFSTFEGYTRTLILLSGNKLVLFHKQTPQNEIVLEHFKPYTFSGGWDTDSTFSPPATVPSIDIRKSSGKIKASASGPLEAPTTDSPSVSTTDLFSPINLHTSHNMVPVDESTDFNIITRDSHILHTCRVHKFSSLGDRHEVRLDTMSEPITGESLSTPVAIKRQTLVLYVFGGEVMVRHDTADGGYQETKLMSGNSLFVQDIKSNDIGAMLKLTSCSGEVHIVVVNLYELDNPQLPSQ
ncbi:hypothetical protein SAMD00019534_025130 [Acytostelium subglobosum LB1]|uniref:hypothetical protein n=1 Tax=Acytostelium subglobosum LB1 TaxID=1410327 RepID=UPI000644B5AD|nr:hypothetical protein SAMD00019534_025130 [Acytostelium subglobosum LB1]GAM19338.1 hypothetical protein SAMD00019534_025130 [Acytostelium subglobosum LB1]|eukprot:XP_012757265.1 hypothetical protein SAMD00019534_025130 [Acytostelium subglobosum LB1]